MRMLLALSLAAVLAACSPATSVTTSTDHPASPTASTAAAGVEYTTLDPVPQPDLPAPLRPDGHPPAGSMAGMNPDEGGMMDMEGAPMDHSAMNHEAMPAMDHSAMSEMQHDAMPMAAAPEGLRAALDAYLAIQTALASDELAGIAKQARALDTAVAKLGETPIEGDPHFWHTHADDLTAIRTNAQALADADDLAAARLAFGRLSAPFVGIVEATGVPKGYDVARFTCGMVADVPEGGVWLQRGSDTRNPYYGSAMVSCGASDHAMPMMDHGTMEGMDHSQMKGMDHEQMKERDHSKMNHDGRP